MPTITKRQRTMLDAEFLAAPYLADAFIDELKIGCFSEIKRKNFWKALQLAQQYRDYAISMSTYREKRLQSKSSERGRRERRKD